MLDGSEFFECQCHSPEHTLRFVLNRNENWPIDPPEIYLSFYLSDSEPWWRRIRTGLLYTLGFSCVRYGWNDVILKQEDSQRLRDMCDEIIKELPSETED